LHKGYVTGKEWVQVQELLEKNKDKSYRASTNNINETVFSGILRCKKCGNKMIPKSNRKNKDGTTTYYYVCREKDRTRRINCNSHNIKGNELDNNFIKILKDIFVPNSAVYQELKNMAFKHNPKEDITAEMETLKKEYEKNEKEIKDLAKKVKYIDISVIKKREDAATNVKTALVGTVEEGVKILSELCRQGRQAFIVCPSIVDAEGYDLNSIESFARDYIHCFDGLKVGILHGKMKERSAFQGRLYVPSD